MVVGEKNGSQVWKAVALISITANVSGVVSFISLAALQEESVTPEYVRTLIKAEIDYPWRRDRQNVLHQLEQINLDIQQIQRALGIVSSNQSVIP